MQGGSSLLQKAKGMVSQWEDLYMLYMLEQDRMARMSDDQNAETSMDMVRLQCCLLVLCGWAKSGWLVLRSLPRHAPPLTSPDISPGLSVHAICCSTTGSRPVLVGQHQGDVCQASLKASRLLKSCCLRERWLIACRCPMRSLQQHTNT